MKILKIAMFLLSTISLSCNGNVDSNTNVDFDTELKRIDEAMKQEQEMMNVPLHVQEWSRKCMEENDQQACLRWQNWSKQSTKQIEIAIEKMNQDANNN